MIKLFWQTLKVAPVLFAASLFAASGASAQTVNANKGAVNETLQQINNYQTQDQNNSLSQVTNVNQLRDVSPTDWAYEALRSLVDRYGCIAGFPNQTYRGNQALSRYEFAAGLNSCLNQIERLIASSEAVSQEDLDTINRLSQEFEAELATLGGRVDEIESRTAILEDNQFSTTTKLKGEVIFSLADAFGGGLDDGDDDTQTTLSNRVRLNFDTSFFGEDRLRTRLEAGNITRFDDEVTGTNSTRLGFDANNDNDIEVSDLHYRFPLTERATAWIGTAGLDLDDIFEVSNPILESSGSGALSRFNRRNPLLFRGTEGAGGGVQLELIPDKVGFNALYLTDDDGSALSSEGEGLFNGSFSAGAQIAVSPIERLDVTATYVRSFQTGDDVDLAGDTVGQFDDLGNLEEGFAAQPFGEIDTTANRFGVGVNFDVTERIIVAGFGGYADVEGLADGDDNNPDGDIWTWGANVSILDLVREGSKLSVAGGMLPKFTSDIGADEIAAGVEEDPDTSYLLEALYRFPLNDNIAITPGAYAVFNPNHNEDNDTVYVGVIRTTFSF